MMNQDIRRKQKKRDLSTQLKTVQQLFKQAFVINKNPYPWGRHSQRELLLPYQFLLVCS